MHRVLRAGVCLITFAAQLFASVPVRAADREEVRQAGPLAKEEGPALNAPREMMDVTPSSWPTEMKPLSAPLGGQKTNVSSQAISVPQGSGKVQGMGESFSMQLSTGVGTFSVPFGMPSARGGVQPAIGLTYSSASGHGVAGLGWSMGVPYIARQTDRGIPKYQDPVAGGAWHPEQDHFVFNGGQELVPICLVTNGVCAGSISGEVMPSWANGWQYFRSRVEGGFVRFFWSPDHREWRVQSKGGDTMVLGALEGDGTRIFRWNISQHHDANVDAQGRPVNVVQYRYLQHGGIAYLSDVYATPPAANAAMAPVSSYAHHARFVYEQRTDPSISYRRGWETSTALRLLRVDVTSKSFEASGARELVRRYHLSYESGYHPSLLSAVQTEGRCDMPVREDGAEALPATSCPRLPAMTFGYSHVAPFKSDGTPGVADIPGYEGFDDRMHTLPTSPARSLDDAQAALMDVDGDSLSDVLVTDPAAYAGDHGLFFGGANGFTESRIAPHAILGADLRLTNANLALQDLDGDGVVDLLHMPKVKSYSVYKAERIGAAWRWTGRAVTMDASQSPKIDFANRNVHIRTMDVNADGLVDVVHESGTEIQTFLSAGRYPGGDGLFGSARWTGATTADISMDPVRGCAPFIGSPARFDDAEIRIADMNGDGLPDIVRLSAAGIAYLPGRGNGDWGTGAPCASGTFGQGRDIKMASGPRGAALPPVGELMVDDVNSDGLDDLVHVGPLATSIWLNVDGAGWTERHLATGVNMPALRSYARLADVNGSGTRDILLGEAYRYRYVDLQGGKRPWLLTRVENGLGKTTELEYASSAELMMAAQKPWELKMPIAVHVVTKVTDRDNLAMVGRPAGAYLTEYTYRDPVYDGQQREFRGFRSVSARRIGDDNSPTAITASTFLLGECREDCAPASRWKDNPREALKGLPVVSETIDEAGTYLATTHYAYRLRRLYEGLDGRGVWHAFESAEDAWSYDTAPFTAAESTIPMVDVEIERGTDGIVIAPSNAATDQVRSVTLRSSAGRVRVQSRARVDLWGNLRESTAEGCIEGCPARDEQITTYTAPNRIVEPGGWMWRTSSTFVMGNAQPSVRRNATDVYFDTAGRPTSVVKTISGGLPLDRFHEDPSRAVAPTPATALLDGVAVFNTVYDAFGNVRFESGPNGRCHAVGYDQAYADLAVSETIHAGPEVNGCGATALTTVAVYDRGLEVVTNAVGLNGEITLAQYDGFGRVTALFKPHPDAVGALSAMPSVRVAYDLATSGRPYSRIHAQTQDGRTHDEDSYRHAYSYVDGFGRTILTLEQADPTAGDGGQWIVHGLTEYDNKGTARRAYLPWFWSGDPQMFPVSSVPPTRYGRQRYDAFGRAVQTFGLDGSVTLQSRYHALSVDKWDAADLAPGPHQGTYASARTDGHGRVVETTERAHEGGAIEERHVRTSFLPTGEPVVIARVRGNDRYIRWIRYDTAGRMVLNVEPSTTKDFNPDPSTAPDAMKAWRYVYNANGDLVGTSDARGCGTNFHYDAAGRLLAEDYSPCQTSHVAYSPPNLGTGDGTEVFYRYDAIDTDAASVILGDPAFGGFPNLYRGRVASVTDRGAKTISRYDARGRAAGIARRITKPGDPQPAVLDRYAPRWYTQVATFDGADRPIAETTGAKVPELMGADGTSRVFTEYTKRGTVKKVGSSYGDLVTTIVREADGPVTKVVYGDLAKTTTESSHDARRRLSSVQTYRGPPASWSSPAYTPAIDGTTNQLLLEDTDFKYDAVDNPIEIRDWRLAHEWPAGAKPVTRKIQYDDLYRVTRVDYQHTGGDDTWVSPFDAENNGQTDPRRATPSPHVRFDKRVRWQTFKYDWLGNTTHTDDDARGFYDRSLGTISNSGYQLRSAAGGTSARDGNLTARYDDAGHLVSMATRRNGPCLPAGAICSQRFVYDWDEVGRLSRARRWDLSDPGVAADPTPNGSPAVDLRHAYDGADFRVLKSAVDAAGNAIHTVYGIGTAELRRAPWNGGDYEQSLLTEVAYVAAHGVRLGRLHYATDDLPRLQSGGLHVLFSLPDHLGSTSIVVDRDTSELVERSTYQPHGASDADYRPGRWAEFREDYRFTGKEEDAEVGLVYFGKRFLAAPLGRWSSADPLAVHGLQADPNVYGYVRGRTFRMTDPLGLEESTVDGKQPAAGNVIVASHAEHPGGRVANNSVVYVPEIVVVGRAVPRPASRGTAILGSLYPGFFAGGMRPVATGADGVEHWEGLQQLAAGTGQEVVAGGAHGAAATTAGGALALGAATAVGVYGPAVLGAVGEGVGELGRQAATRAPTLTEVVTGNPVGGAVTGGAAIAAKETAKASANSGGTSDGLTGTVWDAIRATQAAKPGTPIPHSFELSTAGGNFWVHPNATKHMIEYVSRNGNSPRMVEVNSQAMLTSLRASVETAAQQGIKYGQILQVGRWELIFSNRSGDGLPVLKHALYR